MGGPVVALSSELELSMNAELIALRDAVANTCKFLGPGSRTGRNLGQAMLAAERAAHEAAPLPTADTTPAPAAEDEPFDRGPWSYRTDLKASTHLGRYFVESDDFSHDVRLYINGDFADDDARRAYGEALARTLNKAAQNASLNLGG
jgi:hypothetical protein